MGYTVKEILKLEVAPALGCTEPSAVALGCTEPSAVALGAAVASSLLDRRFDSIELWLDPNTYKNGLNELAVSIPGASGHAGIDLAAALGAFGGDPALKLEVLEPIDPVVVESAVAFVERGRADHDRQAVQKRIATYGAVLRCGTMSQNYETAQANPEINVLPGNLRDARDAIFSFFWGTDEWFSPLHLEKRRRS